MNALTKFSIDIVSRGAAPVAYAVQNDSNTRTIELNLTSNGVAWEIPSGMSVSVAFRKNDGTSGWYDTLPDGSAACSYSDNVVLAVLAPQMLTTCGLVELAVVIQNPSTLDRVATFPLFLDVARDPAAGESVSNDYYNYKTMEQINDAIDELWAAVGSGGSGGSGGSCGCSITVSRKGSEDDPVSLSGYGIGAGDVVRFTEGDYYVEPFDIEGLDHVTFLLGDARIHCVGDHFLEATSCDDLQIIGGTVMGGNGTVMGIQIKDCLRPVLRQVCFNGIGSATAENTKGLVILGDCTGFLVDRCVVDGVSAGVVSSDGWIHAYGILVNRLGSTNAYSRKGQILHCRIANVAGIDTDTVKADGDGIFVQRPPYLDDSGKVAGIDQVIDIDGCVFDNCKKRGVKSAAWGTTVRDCVFEGDFYYAPVDLQYGHGTVDRCRIANSSNYTGSVTSGVVANDGGFTVRDCYINCLYVNEDGTNGRHPGVRMDKRQPGSIFNKTVPWDPILVERCHFDEVSYGVYASTSVPGADTYRLTALEVLDCRWGAFYNGYGVDIEASVFDQIDVVRFVDFRFDAGATKAEVQAVNSSFDLPIMVGSDPAKAYDISSRYWLDTVVASDNKPTAAHTSIVSVGDGCRKEYTAYGSRIWGPGDPNGKASGDPEYALLLGSKVGDEYTDTATGGKYTCTAAGGVGVWEELGRGTAGAVTPQMFGAVGDGKTDDTEAFKKCFEHTNIHIPAGEYVVKETIEVLPRTNVTGDGQYPSKVLFASDVEGDVLFNVQEYASFSDINIGGSGSNATSTCTAIVFPFKILRLHNVRFRFLNEGVRSDAENVLYNTFVDCTFSNVNYPFVFPNAIIFNTSIMQNLEFKNYNAVVTLPGTIYAISFDRCIFEGGEAGDYVLDVAETAGVSFDSCYYENHGGLVSDNAKNGNITLRSTWVCVPDTVVLSGHEKCHLYVKIVDSVLENLNSDEESFGALLDGTNISIDIIDCMTKGPIATDLTPIATAEIASQYGIATNCNINGGYLTLDTLPVYGGEVE